MSKLDRSNWLESYLAQLDYRLQERRLCVCEWQITLCARASDQDHGADGRGGGDLGRLGP